LAIKVFTQDVELMSAPIPAEWVISGSPKARNAVLARSADRTALTMLWDCSAGRFRWRYDQDETIHIIEGSATLRLDDGRVEELRPGVVVFFPAGRTAVWEVHSYVRKLAVFREPVPLTLALVVRSWAKLRNGLAEALRTSRARLETPLELSTPAATV
jgi:uncharacterized protein